MASQQHTYHKRFWKVTKRWKLAPLRKGIRISMAYTFRQNWLLYIGLPFWVLWTLLGIAGIFHVLITGITTGVEFFWIGIYGAIWGTGEIAGIHAIRTYSNTEIMIVTNGNLHVRRSSSLGLLTEHVYDCRRISDIRQVPPSHRSETICFTYDHATHIYLGKALPPEDTYALMTSLSNILTFSCDTTEHIVFGKTSGQQESRSPTLYNPDVSTLTVPFIRLTQIIIDTATYDFHLVERFLTYAINVLGQDYLKHHVTVQLMGSPEKFHPNLRNNLTHYCQKMVEVPERAE